MSFASSDRAVPRGTRSTASPTAARSRRSSAPRGPSAGRPPAGYFTKRQAEAWLRSMLDEARRGTCPAWSAPARRSPTPRPSTCATSARTAGERHRRLRTTARSSASTCLPAFGDIPLEGISVSEVEAFQARLAKRVHNGRPIAPRTRKRCSTCCTASSSARRRFGRYRSIPRRSRSATPLGAADIEVYAPEEVGAGPRRRRRPGRRDLTSLRRSPACAWASCARCAASGQDAAAVACSKASEISCAGHADRRTPSGLSPASDRWVRLGHALAP